MKYLSAIVLFSLSSFVLCKGGYPKDIDIESQILAYLEDDNGKVFCTTVLISRNKCLVTPNCFLGKNVTSEKYYALVGLKDSTKRRYRVEEIINISNFDVIILAGQTDIDDESYKAGLPLDNAVFFSYVGGKSLLHGFSDYGFYNPKEGEPTSAIVTYIPTIRPRAMKHIFRIESRTDHTYHPPNWQGGPVISDRYLFAMCPWVVKTCQPECNLLSSPEKFTKKLKSILNQNKASTSTSHDDTALTLGL